MPRTPPPRAVPLHEVRHFQPADGLHVEPLSVRGPLHQWIIPPHRHEALHQFQLLERGTVRATLDGLVLTLRAPALLVLAAGTVHGFHYDPDCAGHQVTVPSATLRELLADAPALREQLGRSFVLDAQALGHEAADAVDLMLALAREYEGQRLGRGEALRAQALLLALWCLRRAAPASAAGTRSSAGPARAAVRDTLVQRFRTLVDLHYRSHHPLAFYTRALEVSADHLSRACRSAAGLSALDLVHERLLLEAKRLLAYTELPVARVAADLGFDDAAYFSRFFARKVGLAPMAWRRAAALGMAGAAAVARGKV